MSERQADRPELHQDLVIQKDAEKEYSDMPLKDALLHVEAVFGIDANDHLPQKKVAYGYESYFIGCDYLGDNKNLAAYTDG